MEEMEFSGYARRDMAIARNEALEAAESLYPADEIAFDTVAAIKALGKPAARKALLELKAFYEDLTQKLMAIDVSEDADEKAAGLKLDCVMADAKLRFNWENPLLEFALDEDELQARKKARLC